MAHILGTSQAWQQVVRILTSRNLTAENKNDLKRLLNTRISVYEKRKTDETAHFDAELIRLIKELDERKNHFQPRLANYQRTISLDIELSQIAILLLQDETRFFRKILNRAKIQNLRKNIDRLRTKQNKYHKALLDKIAKLETSINYRQANRETIISNNCSPLMQDINLLKSIFSSPELAGADAELEIIEHLRKLPDSFYVINGITLARDKAKLFDGQWLKTAQIDHLVITPAGVFVIEAKNWSMDFTKHGNYYDPYQQVKRASYLCYEILRSSLFEVKVKSIIAYRGRIPEKPKESHVKVLLVNELNNYILWYKDKILSDTEIKNMISLLKIWSTDEF